MAENLQLAKPFLHLILLTCTTSRSVCR